MQAVEAYQQYMLYRIMPMLIILAAARNGSLRIEPTQHNAGANCSLHPHPSPDPFHVLSFWHGRERFGNTGMNVQ
ncbi:hypothetical protein [Burkholderia sp. WSM2230]|uniref:hypothetical protein n=1 Tax=Burkholderia sp. WSM2230 TaxID=944435 RepID=UPI0003FE5B35|nr:hypothetical protein [Burkholderia sp. WSM2230]